MSNAPPDTEEEQEDRRTSGLPSRLKEEVACGMKATVFLPLRLARRVIGPAAVVLLSIALCCVIIGVLWLIYSLLF